MASRIRVAFFLLLLASCSSTILLAQDSNPGRSASPVRRPSRMLQSGHSGSIQAIAVSPDGRWLASGGYDKNIILWNRNTGEQEAILAGETSAVIHLAYNPDGRQLASTSVNGNVRIWDTSTRRLLRSFRLRGAAHLQYTSDGKYWVANVDGGPRAAQAALEVHDAATGALVRIIPTDWFLVTAMTLTTDGRIIAAGTLDGESFSPGSVHIWNLSTGAKVKTLDRSSDTFSPDGRWMGWIDSAKSPRRLVVSEVATGTEKLNAPLANEQAIYFSPDGEHLVMTDPMSSKLKLWSITSGEVRTLGEGAKPGDLGLSAAAFSADGKQLIAGPYADHTITVWDVASGKPLQSLYGQAMVQGMTLSRDGKQLIAGSAHGLDFWDIASGHRTMVAPIGSVNETTLSPDGQWLAINPGVRFRGETLAVWDMRAAKVAAEFTFGKGGTPVTSMAWVINDSPLKALGPFSRSFEFTADDGRHTIWSSPSPAASSPDGKILVEQFGMGGTLRVWDMTSGQMLTTLDAHKISLTGVAFSADGRSLLTLGQESRVVPGMVDNVQWGLKVWDTQTWQVRFSRMLKRSGAPTAAFSPDGSRIALETAWDKVEVLNAETGALIETLAATDPNRNYHQFSPNNVLFSADATEVFQGAQNGVRVWKLTETETK